MLRRPWQRRLRVAAGDRVRRLAIGTARRRHASARRHDLRILHRYIRDSAALRLLPGDPRAVASDFAASGKITACTGWRLSNLDRGALIISMPSDEGGVTVPFARSDAINQSVWGFKDLAPLFSLRWQQGDSLRYRQHYDRHLQCGAARVRATLTIIGRLAAEASAAFPAFPAASGKV